MTWLTRSRRESRSPSRGPSTDNSPMWLRVDDPDVGPERLLDGVEQVAGHTTPSVFRRWTEADFRAAGLSSSTRAATASARVTTRATTDTG